MHDIRTLIGKINIIAAQQAMGKTTRRMALSTAALVRGPVENARKKIEGIAEVAAFAEAEADSWIDPEDITAGKSGPFDVCDLRHWLIIAEMAGVDAVPAREILSLSEDEISAIDQKVHLPGFIQKSISRGLTRAFPEMKDMPQEPEAKINPAEINERLFDAMDDVPANWIVRSNLAGPSTLKAFAGAGVISQGDDAASLDPNLSIGPGWVRHGNRRRVDATDSRFIDTFAGAHKPRLHYLARPWITAGVRVNGDDPHRHGTPFAGKGNWPLEWRVFVENGVVTGVACYYGWIGSKTAENAVRALKAAELAQKMVDTARDRGLSTRYMDVEMMREMGSDRAKEMHAQTLSRFPRDGINCSLDFFEGPDGPLFLEAGPAHTSLGGGHPCSFAGNKADPAHPAISECKGVAFKLMDHVIMADPATWTHDEASTSIVSWEEARALASTKLDNSEA